MACWTIVSMLPRNPYTYFYLTFILYDFLYDFNMTIYFVTLVITTLTQLVLSPNIYCLQFCTPLTNYWFLLNIAWNVCISTNRLYIFCILHSCNYFLPHVHFVLLLCKKKKCYLSNVWCCNLEPVFPKGNMHSNSMDIYISLFNHLCTQTCVRVVC